MLFVMFEATGVYDRALAEVLQQFGILFARVNPARARDFARAGGLLAKTGAIHARMLAAFVRPITHSLFGMLHTGVGDRRRPEGAADGGSRHSMATPKF
jgi:transposase